MASGFLVSLLQTDLEPFAFSKDFMYLFFRQRRRKGEKTGGNINVWLPLACPPPGTWPATQACALTGNQTSVLLVRRPALSPLSHTSQGSTKILMDFLH